MFKKRKQNVIYLVLVLLLVVLFLGLLFTGRLNFVSHETYDISTDSLRVHAKDFSVDQTAFVAESDDPWFDIEVPRGRYGKITLDVASMNRPSTICAIYHCLTENGSFSEEQCIRLDLMQGENIVALPDQEIDRLRLDLTNEKGVSIELNGIRLVGEKIVISGRTSFSVLVALLLILLILIPVSALLVRLSMVAGEQIRRLLHEKPKMLLALLMIVSIMICFGRYMFGGKYFAFLDIGSDMVYDYQPRWFSIMDDYSAGRVAQWTLNYGLGTSSLSQLFWILDPFLWPTMLAYLFVNYHVAQITVAWMQGLKLLLCALLCYDFLSEFSLGNVAKIVAAYIYGFCGYVMLWGQHYMFSTSFMISTLVLLFLERSLKQEKIGKQHLLFVLSVAWLAIKSYYLAYMSLLAMAIYVLIRLFYIYPVRNVRRWMFAGIRTLMCVLLGFVVGGVFLLPQIYQVITVSDRLSNGGSIFQYFFLFAPDHMKTLLSRVFSNNLLGIRDYKGYLNYYESEQLFFSSFMPLFFMLYVMLGLQEGRKTFVVRLAGILALCVLTIMPVTGYIMNAFVYPSFRYTFVYMPVYAYVAAKVIDGIVKRKVTILQLALALMPYPLIIYYISDSAGLDKPLCMFLMGCVLCGTALIGIYRIFPRAGRAVRLLLVAVILVNVLTDSWMTTNLRTTLDDVYTNSQITKMTSTVKKINNKLIKADPQLYRVEKTYTDYSFWNDALIEDYYGVSAYNSVVNSGVRAFYRNCWDDVIYFADGNYIQFEKDYKNAQMASLLGVKYLISEKKIKDVPTYSFYKKMNGKYVYINKKYKGFGRFYTGTMTIDDYYAHAEEERDALLQDYIILDHQEDPSAAGGKVEISRPVTDDHIEVYISAEGDGYVFLPIPYENGWKATINGIPQTILNADFGFMAVPVAAGETKLVLEYRIPMLKEGALMSVIGVLIIGLIFALNRKSGIMVPRNRARKAAQAEPSA